MKDNPIIAVIDIGSNSIRLQISKVLDGTYKVIDDYKETARIGDNVYKTGKFSDDAIDTIKQILLRMKSMMDYNKVETCRAVATASFREAANAEEVVTLMKSETGVDIEIISGIEEARLMYLATSSFFQMDEGNTLLIDMGGGSTEFSYASGGGLQFSESTPLGCSKLTYEYFKNDPVKQGEIIKLKQKISDYINPFLPQYGVDKLVCSGGTLNNISLIYNKRKNLSDSVVKFVDSVFVRHFTRELTGKSIEERLRISGLEPARADIILSASILVQMILERYRLEGFYTLSGGLRAGLTIDLMNRIGMKLVFQDSESSDIRYTRLIETGKKYYFEETHAIHVTKLAKRIFDGLSQFLRLSPEDWALLEAASILHDVGQYISYSKHHKHSYYLLMNTELTGYNDKEREVIANIARYHRRGLPKKNHENFMKLTAIESDKVMKLGAILRVADALDRAHSSLIKDVSVEVKPEGIEFTPLTDNDICMEIQGFDKKKDLLEVITGKSAVIL